MKRKDLKLGESYYVNTAQDHDLHGRYKHTAERKLVHLGPFSRESRDGFHRSLLSDHDRTVTLEDGREALLPYGYFPTGKFDKATHVLVENLSTGRFEAVSTTSIRLPWSEFVTLRDEAVRTANDLENLRKERAARENALAAKIQEAHPDIKFRLVHYAIEDAEARIRLSELARIAGIEVEAEEGTR